MYVDAQLQLSLLQSIVGTGNIISTNTIDLSQSRDMGEGNNLFARFQVGTAVAGATSVEMQVITADDAALSSNVTVIESSGAIPIAQLTAGKRFVQTISPRIGSNGQRYLGARYVIAGTSTAGTIAADVGLDFQGNGRAYPSGFTVL